MSTPHRNRHSDPGARRLSPPPSPGPRQRGRRGRMRTRLRAPIPRRPRSAPSAASPSSSTPSAANAMGAPPPLPPRTTSRRRSTARHSPVAVRCNGLRRTGRRNRQRVGVASRSNQHEPAPQRRLWCSARARSSGFWRTERTAAAMELARRRRSLFGTPVAGLTLLSVIPNFWEAPVQESRPRRLRARGYERRLHERRR